MHVKIGDFGLATEISFDGERKRTLCGTPNYIAPEILTKAGHSHEVDIWSTGCIMYTLLVGKPPFETTSLKETYKRIKMCEYIIPGKLIIYKDSLSYRVYNLGHSKDLFLYPVVWLRNIITIVKHNNGIKSELLSFE